MIIVLSSIFSALKPKGSINKDLTNKESAYMVLSANN